MRFLTTTVPDHRHGQIELQRGLHRSQACSPRRSTGSATVELTSTPIHRMLGLAKVEIGTASGAKQDDDKFVLDSLPTGGGATAAGRAAAPRGHSFVGRDVLRGGCRGDRFG